MAERKWTPAVSPWDTWAALQVVHSGAACNICGWAGDSFIQPGHSERATCPTCGSVARDRCLFHAFITRTPGHHVYRVLETSPRLGTEYRSAMSVWFRYLASDFDLRAHSADVQIDLQAIDLEDGSIDVLLTPHVLEHLPDTDKALSEIHRILSPSGRMYLQVPLLQGSTAPPETPEFHGDNTPVFWRFGLDLTVRLRRAGFATSLLCPDEFRAVVRHGTQQWPEPTAPEFSVDSMLAAADPADLTPFADSATAHRLGLFPSYMFLLWECLKGPQAKAG